MKSTVHSKQPRQILIDYPVTSRQRDRSALPRVWRWLGCLLMVVVLSVAPTWLQTASALQSPAATVSAAEVAPYLGYYTPNTFIELRDSTLWFIRPPFESQLLPLGDDIYIFERGWVKDKRIQFRPNDTDGYSIMIQSDQGDWHEFARSGESYPDLGPATIAALQEILEQAVANSRVPGVVLYINVPKRGTWLGARGVANRAIGMPMVPDDRFRIASNTKVFVATVVLQLAAEGHLTLDDTVEQWLPGLLPNGAQITVRHLLNHTSGIYNYLDGRFVNLFLSQPNRMWQPREMVDYARAYPLRFAPGAAGRWQYSNTNYIVLGLLVEHITGIPLSQAIRDRIIEPLELNNTFFDAYETIPGGVAHGYLNSNDYTNINLSFAWAAGGMVSTARDLGRFMQALFGGKLLNEYWLNEMRTFVEVPAANNATIPVYGLGLMADIATTGAWDGRFQAPYDFGPVYGHTGGLTGYRSVMGYVPEHGITVVVWANQMFFDPTDSMVDALQVLLDAELSQKEADP